MIKLLLPAVERNNTRGPDPFGTITARNILASLPAELRKPLGRWRPMIYDVGRGSEYRHIEPNVGLIYAFVIDSMHTSIGDEEVARNYFARCPARQFQVRNQSNTQSCRILTFYEENANSTGVAVYDVFRTPPTTQITEPGRRILTHQIRPVIHSKFEVDYIEAEIAGDHSMLIWSERAHFWLLLEGDGQAKVGDGNKYLCAGDVGFLLPNEKMELGEGKFKLLHIEA